MSAATVRIAERDVPALLEMLDPLPGLPGRTSYLLEPLDETGVLFALRSQDEDAAPARLFVVDPTTPFPTYTPDLGGPEEHVALVVVHPPTDQVPATANLLAPLIVDVATGRTVQAVQDEDWPLRAPLG